MVGISNQSCWPVEACKMLLGGMHVGLRTAVVDLLVTMIAIKQLKVHGLFSVSCETLRGLICCRKHSNKN